MFGPPARMETSKPDMSTSTRGKEVASWNDLGTIRGKWMACYYGGGPDLILSRPIDDRVLSCKVVRTKKRFQYLIDARCSW